MGNTIEITTPAIRKHLRQYTPERAISEYIWNGFDAGATCVEIDFKDNGLGLGGYSLLEIIDNGMGISHYELNQKFKPYFDSEKKYERDISLPHGRNGYGRFTFIAFSSNATWETVYRDENKLKKFNISISSENLENYPASQPIIVDGKTGTKVIFRGLIKMDEGFLNSTLLPYLKKEFAWFIFLYPEKNIIVNGTTLNIKLIKSDELVLDDESFMLKYPKNGVEFSVQYVQWKEKINNEYSRLYYLSEDSKERFKETTKLNNKGDSFYHSLYIKSIFFKDFQFSRQKKDLQLLPATRDFNSDEFVFLEKELISYLKKKRKPFLERLSIKIVEEYEKLGVIAVPNEQSSPIEKYTYESVKETVAELYQIEPKIFLNFNEEQRVTFVGLLSAIIQSGNAKNDILKILDSVIKMDSKERTDLAQMLDRVSLNGLLKIAKLIEERYAVYEEFKRVTIEDEKSSYEKDVQSLVENNLWIIDEAYYLITAEEPDFEEALRKLLLLNGEVSREKIKIDSPDKNKEMDIFACRQRNDGEGIQHLVVELKRPKIKINRDHWIQLDTYKNVILGESRFQSRDAVWKFYLIGNKLDDFIENQKKTLRTHGDRDLIFIDADYNFRGYAITWAQVFDRFKIRHDHLREKLTEDINLKNT